jgi:hypothetical protein
MAKYMLLYNSTASASQLMANATPEQMKASMAEWTRWRDEAVKKVKFDFGMPLEATGRVTPAGVSNLTSPIGGYSIMEGGKDEIVNLLKTHPHLKREGASIDLLEMLSMPGM